MFNQLICLIVILKFATNPNLQEKPNESLSYLSMLSLVIFS